MRGAGPPAGRHVDSRDDAIVLSGGQRRVHFVKERRSRKCEILASLVAVGLETLVYRSDAPDIVARRRCLKRLADDVSTMKVTRLVLEVVDGYELRDRQILHETLRAASRLDIVYEHMYSREEPMLAVPDALAWAYGAGGDWRRRMTPTVAKVEYVDP